MIEVKAGQTWALGPPGGDTITFYVQRVEKHPTRVGLPADELYAHCTVGATGNEKWIPVRSLQPPRYRLVRDEHGQQVGAPGTYKWHRGTTRRPWLLIRDADTVADLSGGAGAWFWRVFDGGRIIDSGDALPFGKARAEAEAVARHLHDGDPLPNGVTLD